MRDADDTASWVTAITTIANYALLIVVGFLRDLLCGKGRTEAEGYAPLLNDWQDFYTRRLYHRIQDCFNRPIDSAPGAWCSVMLRDFDPAHEGRMQLTGESMLALNLSSYNYLGFAESELDLRDDVIRTLRQSGASACSSRSELGTCSEHLELEALVADFIGKEAAMVIGMGFASNSAVLPALVNAGDLVLSDELNHRSIVDGARLSQATVRVFRHNCARSLQRELRMAIARGQPRTRRPWRKIVVLTEGLFSMEGAICNLAAISAVCKRYRAYLYVDEAHSIGALGRTGRGVREHCGVEAEDVDVFMGTFTKAFGSVGGYIAASREVVTYLKRTCACHLLACSLSPVCARQAIAALRMIRGDDGTTRGAQKLQRIKDNANAFRAGLKQLGYQTLGDLDSPVIPALLFQPAKIPAFSRACLARKLAVVVVGSPATPLLKSRVRFCISAAHEWEDLAAALRILDDVGSEVMVKYKPPQGGPRGSWSQILHRLGSRFSDGRNVIWTFK